MSNDKDFYDTPRRAPAPSRNPDDYRPSKLSSKSDAASGTRRTPSGTTRTSSGTTRTSSGTTRTSSGTTRTTRPTGSAPRRTSADSYDRLPGRTGGAGTSSGDPAHTRPAGTRPASSASARPSGIRPAGSSGTRPSGASGARPSGSSGARPSGASGTRPSGPSGSRPSGPRRPVKKKKDPIISILIPVLAVVALVLLGALLLPKLLHKHTYEKKITTEATCTAEGVATYTCSKCGKSYTESIPITHNYVESVVAATYDEKGYTLHKCSLCGDEYRDNETPKLERKPDDLAGAKITGLEESYKYTGKEIVPQFTVTLLDKVLTADTDYTISYKNNIEAGTATVTLTGLGTIKNSYSQNFEIIRQGWEESEGNKYYYDNGLVTGLSEIEGGKYYFDENGVMQTGWIEIDGGYYCFDRLDGKLAVSTSVDGITVDATGKAETSDYNTLKITTMMTAHKIMLEQTLPTDTMEEKRLKVFKWEYSAHGYQRWRLLKDVIDTPDWEMVFANDIFKRGDGCCVSDACAAAFLIREIGYTDIYVCHDTSHCWFTVGGKLYDPLFAEAKDFDKNYDAEYTDYRQWPAGRRRIDGVGTDV